MTVRNYLGVAERAEGNWSISFPAFPGTVTAGQTLAELYTHAKDALASVVEAMQEDGQALPDSLEASPDDAAPAFKALDYANPHIMVIPVDVGGIVKRINVTMDEGLVARVDSFADRVKSSRSAVLARGARMVLAQEAAE